jgi:predicted GNAT superfamily acetyltransferase
MFMETLTLKPLETAEELYACEELQKVVWHFTDREVIATHFLLSILHEGSAMIYGAFAEGIEEGPTAVKGRTLVGWLFGYPVIVPAKEAEGKLIFRFYSDMMGVLPQYQSRNIGYRLKLEQRKFTLSLGLDWVVWTYDPLLSKNARLNVAKLGVVVRRYVENAYGDLTGINAGLPTDRFHVDWWVASERVARRISGLERPPTWEEAVEGGAVLVNPISWRNGMPWPSESWHLPQDAPKSPVLVEIPPDFLWLKERDMELARAWRFHMRDLMETAFGLGYEVVDYLFEKGNPPRGAYLLKERREWK